jgi:arginyl-tRNA synthetase
VIGPDELGELVRAALERAGLPERTPQFERPRQREHGDWSTNVALTLAKPVGRPPRDIAQELVEQIGTPAGVDRVELAGPGFINFHLSHGALEEILRQAVQQGSAWGRTAPSGEVRRANVEFVSANPTGPLHVGAGRWVATGDAIAGLLEATGWEVTREYYLNDAGSQLDLFGDSVRARMAGDEVPPNGYKGAYVDELAAELADARIPEAEVTEAAYQRMLLRIKQTMERAGIDVDVWFSERTLHASGAVERIVERLREAGHVYDDEGAVWLRTTAFGDDKDRVLLRADGRPTYFAADCAYMESKAGRGFDLAIYLLGADHHGYVKRLEAIAAAESRPKGWIEVIIGQLVNLLRGGEAVRMSKRAGELITFDELLDEVGVDAARYTFLRTSLDVSMDFDIAEVVKQDRENPVYYVQYSHARIAGIMRTATERGVRPGLVDDADLGLLVHPTEAELIRRIGVYPETVVYAAETRGPHRVARYAEDLAEAFHKFYTECQVIGDDEALTRARYWLCVATRQTLVNALGLLGVTAPDRM